MIDIYENLSYDIVNELGLDAEVADRIVGWLNTEGVLDREILEETYGV